MPELFTHVTVSEARCELPVKDTAPTNPPALPGGVGFPGYFRNYQPLGAWPWELTAP